MLSNHNIDASCIRSLFLQFPLLMFDIDHFKKINDTHGHPVRDKVLIALAAMAKSTFRPDDFIARYGGEEFAVILYDSGTFYASRAAERYRLLVSNELFEYERGNGAHQLRFTVSLGAAAHANDTVDSIVERADKALHLAKNSVRNQVEAEEDSQDEKKK